MPTVLDPNASGRSGITISDDFAYKYPKELNLRPDSRDHQKILDAIYRRAQESSAEISKRFPSWKKVDETLTAYIRLDESEQTIKTQDDRKPLSIVVPYSYATMETILTYFVTAFLDQPIFKYEGSGPEDISGAFLLERVIEQQVASFKVALNLHTMFRDSLSYGIGIVSPRWDKKWGWKTVLQPQGFFSTLFSGFRQTGMVRGREEVVLYEGNRLKNVDPYLFLPDPNVPIHDVQMGEFVGWIEPTNYHKLLEMEQNDEDIFNVKYLKDIGQGGGSQFNKVKSDSGRGSKYSMNSRPNASSTTPIDVIWLYWNLIPKDYGLGDSEYPEKWLFGLAADKVVICAKRLGLNHDMFPVVTCAPDFDGYSTCPVSRLELMYGMQTTIDWLFNSHVSNVRKAINDMLIVDPSLINMADLQDPKPGKLIRMRRAAWGRGVENAVKQLAVTDITRSNIGDVASLIEYMQRTSAATDSLSGIQRTHGERVTATESRDTRSSALSRLQKAAMVASMQAMDDISYMFASHTQQLMSKEVFIKATGEWALTLAGEYGQQRVRVSPNDIVIDYDLIRKDGSITGGEYVDSWVELYRIMSQQPWLAQQFDMVRIFKHVARLMGAKDLNDFVLQRPNMQVMPMAQGQLEQGVQSGNIVPIDKMG